MSKQTIKSEVLKAINKRGYRPASLNQIVEKLTGKHSENKKIVAEALRDLIIKGDVTVDANWRLHKASS